MLVVEIDFKTEKLQKVCNNDKLMLKTYGKQSAQKLRDRLDDLRDASTLHEMKTLPGHCHELTGDRKHQLALNLAQGLRLIFEPRGEQIHKADGGLDWNVINQIRILSIENYHD